ncbi:alpha-galactosidase [Pedococcus sp. 5OH_020]|uniref:alpha-galactosidase n=1 Tax=Pedococcus sp. 5OH_020 TaxID=2989814 RepID=UPI0022E9D127|nr:alpha-galactosidase [Pedococcus sp. 5OH_020]
MTGSLAVLSAAGTSLVLEVSGGGLPRVLHWGAELPPEAVAQLPLLAAGPVPHNALDEAWPFTVLPTSGDGWLGTPAYAVHRAGGVAAPRWRVTCESRGDAGLRVLAADQGVEVELDYDLDPDGVLRVRLAVTHTAEGSADLLDVGSLRALLPLPRRAGEVLDLTGRWCRERAPQRSTLQDGTHLRASRRGRTGHDATLLLTVGTPGFGFRSGEVWAVHTAWSGNHEHLVERLPEGAGMHAAVLGGAELLEPGEVRLAPGERYTAPEVVFVHATDGLDGLSRRLHRSQRARATHTASPRPLVLNTWEAVYFDHDLQRLTALADTAAGLGVERFVLDDGWFGSRRDDQRGLGDWVVSPQVWPDGLDPLVEHVKGLGMEFGLWFEPEMVNADSDLVRAHPGWVLGPRAGHPRESRHQQVLDLANPEAAAHVEGQISSLVRRLGIDFVKWDHNRDLHEAVRSDGTAADRHAVHAQTTAFYALLDRLRAAHPDLEIESCSSGGARVDLGVLSRTDRIWTSDCNDALERAQIQRWTSLLVPAELMGSHVGPPTAHTTHRTVDLSFRMLLALQGHAGLEWDVSGCTSEELEALRAWSALYRELRSVVHSGDLVRADDPDPGTTGLLVTGTVATDRGEAVYTVARLHTAGSTVPGLVPLPGLAPQRAYRLRVRPEAGLPHLVESAPPSWWEQALREGVEVSGALLGDVGLPLPVLAPAQGFLLHLT